MEKIKKETKKTSKKSAVKQDLPWKTLVKGIEAKAPIEKSYFIDEKEIKITFYPSVGFDKQIEMIYNVEDMCFDVERKSIDNYHPYLVDFAIKYYAISYYTDFVLPQNLNDAWLILYRTDIYNNVWIVAGDELENVIYTAKENINNKVEYLKNKNEFSNLIEKIGNVVEKVSEKIENSDISELKKLIPETEGFKTTEIPI